MKARKVLEKILSGSRNIRFEDACRLAKALGFELDRTRGSHHIFV
ncbi:MAG TPA: type II toxin-antitoxin system HicA family toxin, partial [Verrucomicrobiae bacterium]